jgi:hypothetical protein
VPAANVTTIVTGRAGQSCAAAVVAASAAIRNQKRIVSPSAANLARFRSDIKHEG